MPICCASRPTWAAQSLYELQVSDWLCLDSILPSITKSNCINQSCFSLSKLFSLEMNSLAFSVGNYTPKKLNIPICNHNTVEASNFKFKISCQSHENFVSPLTAEVKEIQALLKRREAMGVGFFTVFTDVLLQPLPIAEAAEEAGVCELTVTPSGLAFCDKVVGTGPEAVKGQLIKVIYKFINLVLANTVVCKFAFPCFNMFKTRLTI